MNDRDPTSHFSQYRNFDPKARLEEFNRRFDEIKSQFPSSSPRMFESHPGWTTNSANTNMANSRDTPIRDYPPKSGNGEPKVPPQFADMMNDSKFHHAPFHPSHHRFSREFEIDEDLEQQGHRVHHIPIHIEPRAGNVNPATGSNRASREPSPMPQSAQAARTPTPQQTRQANQYESVPIQMTQQPVQEETFRTKSPGARVQSIPIQISKSSSAGSTPAPSNQQQEAPHHTQTNHPINESASDPAIADPNKVYAMNYEPQVQPQPVNQTEPVNKIPEVVPMPYEAPKTTNVNEQPSSGDGATQKPPKEETPFDYVDEIMGDLRNYEQQVNEIQPTGPDDKGYRWLDEMLTLCVLRLDCINIDGNEELRKYRKNAINEVNRVSARLEAKVPKDAPQQTENEEAASTSMIEKPTKEKKPGVFNKIFKKKNPNSIETDRNNNPNSSSSDQASETGSNSSGSAVTLPGRETEV